MGTASVTYDNFVNGTASDADQVDQNFADLVAFLNGEVVHLDGTKTMTGILTLPASPPTGDNHATRKKYVDDLVAQGPAAQTLSYHPSTSFASDTVSATGSIEEWGSGGSNVITIANPNRKVSIYATLIGDVSSSAAVTVGVRLGITIDGNTANSTYGYMSDRTCGALARVGQEAQHARVGVTPTGSIKVIPQIRQTGGSPGDATWNSGNIVVLVIPAI